MNSSNTLILIPTLNEEQAIGKVIDEIQEYTPSNKLLIIDSYSTDKTATTAWEKGARVIYAPRGGKGKALRTTLPNILITYQASQLFIMLDGDYTYPAKYIKDIIVALQKSDVVVGYRQKLEAGSMPLANRMGNKGLSLIASILYQKKIKDLCSGMWGFRRSALSKFKLTSNGFTLEADLFINTVKNKLRLAQVPIEYRPRLEGSKAKLRLIDGLKIGWFLLRKRFSD